MEKIIQDLKKKVASYVLPDGIDVIPPYASIKSNKEEFYSCYRAHIVRYQELCKALSELQYMLVTIDRLLRELPNTNEVFSKQKYFSTELKNIKEEVRGLVDSYKYRKEGSEAAVRFHSNAQYILTSYRMEEV